MEYARKLLLCTEMVYTRRLKGSLELGHLHLWQADLIAVGLQEGKRVMSQRRRAMEARELGNAIHMTIDVFLSRKGQ